MNNWINTFHKTSCKSTLSEQDIIDVFYMLQSGHISKSHKDYRKVRALQNKLCPHKLHDCSCTAANHIEN